MSLLFIERNQCLVCSFVSYNTNGNIDGVLSSIHTSYGPRGEGIDEIRGWRECVCVSVCVQRSNSLRRTALDGVVNVCIGYFIYGSMTWSSFLSQVIQKYIKKQCIKRLQYIRQCINDDHVFNFCSGQFRSNSKILWRCSTEKCITFVK